MEWDTSMTQAEKDLSIAIIGMILISMYPSKRVAQFLRNIAEKYEDFDQSQGPCNCRICINERLASMAKNN